MKIKNAKIKNATTRLDNKDRLIVSIEFHEAVTFSTFVFKLANPVELGNFKKLMEFAEVTELSELNGKIVRLAEHEDVILVAVGHPIEDRFVDVTNTMVNHIEEVTEAELLKDHSEGK